MREARRQSPAQLVRVGHCAEVAGGVMGREGQLSRHQMSEAELTGPQRHEVQARFEGPLAHGRSPQTAGQDVPAAWLFSHNLMISRKEIRLARQPHLLQSRLFFVSFVPLPCVTLDSAVKLAEKTNCPDGGMGRTMDAAQYPPLIFSDLKKRKNEVRRQCSNLGSTTRWLQACYLTSPDLSFPICLKGRVMFPFMIK